MQTLTIQNIETKMTKTGNTKVILVCQEGKFYFYRDTKNGSSKAQQQFDKFRFKLGDSVQAEVKTEQKTFVNDQGKEITFNDNWIQYFAEVEGNPAVGANTPVPTENASYAKPEANNDEIAALNARLDKASDAFKALRDEMLDRMKSLEALVSTVTSENAVALHTSLKNRDITEPKTPSIEEAANIVDSHKEIPIINELPKGFN